VLVHDKTGKNNAGHTHILAVQQGLDGTEVQASLKAEGMKIEERMPSLFMVSPYLPVALIGQQLSSISSSGRVG